MATGQGNLKESSDQPRLWGFSAIPPQENSPKVAAERGETIEDSLLTLAQRLFQADAYALWRYFPEKGDWEVVADAGLSEGYSRSISRYSGVMPSQVLVFEDVMDAPMLESRRAGYESEGIRSLLCAPLRLHGTFSAYVTFYFRQSRTFSHEDVLSATALGNLAASAISSAELHQQQQALRETAQTAQRRSAFMAEASRILASSLDYETTLAHVAQLVVPHLADWFTVHLKEGEALRQVAVGHVDPDKIEWAREVHRRFPPNPNAPRGLAQVVRTGKTELYHEITDEMLVQATRDPEYLQILRNLGFTSVLMVPLRARDEVLGAITLIAAESRLRYEPQDMEIAEDLAQRIATAIDNARLYRRAVEAVDALTVSEARFRRLVESNIVGISFGTLDGTIREANDAFLKLLGYTVEELHAGALKWDALVPPDQEAVAGNAAQELLTTGVCAAYETELVRRDGSRVAVLVGGARLDDPDLDGVAFVMDLTERKRLEGSALQLASIVATTDDAIISKDLNGVVRSWNQAAERLFGYTAAEIVGHPMAVLFPPDLAGEEPEILRRLRQGERIQTFETVRRHKGGHDIPVSVTISPVRDGAGKVVGASHIARDITRQKALQEELQQKIQDLATAHRQKDQFLAMLAHELRNPLASISNAVQVLDRSRPGEPAFTRALDVARRQVNQQRRIVDDLLDVSRLTQGRIELRRERVELGSLLREVAEDVREACRESRLALTLDLPEEPLWVDGDRVRLAQIVVNLLTNAIKYTDPGGTVSLRAVRDAPGRSVSVLVEDSGIGIDPELLPHLFQAFSQGKQSLARSRGGLGLGLALVKGLVELHEGEVSVNCRGVGEGSLFTLSLPLSGEPPVPTASSRTEDARPCRVLVIEDLRDAADTLHDLLEYAGHQAEVAYTGAEGLEALTLFLPEVVLCDIGLPGMDGYDVARRIREMPEGRNVLLVALTGYGQPQDRDLARAAGFDHHLLKPVDPPVLFDLLATRTPRPGG